MRYPNIPNADAASRSARIAHWRVDALASRVGRVESTGQRITAAGYNWSAYGENVAYGYSSPESVMQGWMTSPGHKANILNCSFKEIGVGLAQPGYYWTQDFAASR